MPEIVKIVLIWVGISSVASVIFIGGLIWFSRNNKVQQPDEYGKNPILDKWTDNETTGY